MKFGVKILSLAVSILLVAQMAFPPFTVNAKNGGELELVDLSEEINDRSSLQSESETELVVVFTEELVEEQIEEQGIEVQDKHELKIAEKLSDKGIKTKKIKKEKKQKDNPETYIIVELNNKADMDLAKEELAGLEGVSYVEPVTYYYADSFDDAKVADQWALPVIDAYPAWSGNQALSSVVIAILDTGIKLTHLDLSSSIISGYDYIDNDSDPTDMRGHGTHVAGIAAALSNNGYGIASPAGGAKIMPVRVLGADGKGTSTQVANGIRYAADFGADIINMSLGSDTASTIIQNAVNYALGKGCLIIASAGNDYRKGSVGYPAGFDGVIIASSLSEGGSNYICESDFSNYDPALTSRTIHSPGDYILSTYYSSDTSFANMSGTSMAAPYVSGMAAAILARGGYTGSLYNKLLASTVKVPRSVQSGSGVIADPINFMNVLNDNGNMDTPIQKNYKVSFSSYGGSPSPAAQVVAHGGMATEPAAMTRSGYTFEGWYTSSSFTALYDFSKPVYGSISIYAKWVEIPVYFNVTFHTNAGTPIPPAQKVLKDQLAVEPQVTRAGYTFEGWYTTIYFGGIPYNFSDKVNYNDIDLYAKWKAIGPVCAIGTQSFNSLEEALAAHTNGQTIEILSDIVYEKEIFVDGKVLNFDLNGHVLFVANPAITTDNCDGLYVVNDGEVTYEGSGEFNVTGSENYGCAINVTLGGKATVTNIYGSYSRDGIRNTGGEITVNGNCGGRISVSGAGKVLVKGNVAGPGLHDAMTVYSGEVIVQGNIECNSNGVSATGKDAYVKVYGDVSTYDEDFSGTYVGTAIWAVHGSVEVLGNINAQAFGIYASYPESNVIVHGDVNVTASRNSPGTFASGKWGAKVTVNGNWNAPIFAEVEGTVISEQDFITPTTKLGYFTYSVTGSYGTSDLWLKDQNVTSYTVSFAANGGSPIPAAQSVLSGGFAAAPGVMTKSGFTFVGWYKDAAFTQTYNFSSPVVANFTLYAKWTQQTYAVTFVANGGSPAPAAQIVASGAVVAQPAAMTKAGYVFKGWYQTSDFSGSVYDFSGKISSALTLYAKWASVITVSFNTNGGSAVAPIQVEQGTALGTLPVPTRSAYVFAGWYKDSKFRTVASGSAIAGTSNMTLYAKWTAEPAKYTVTFVANGGTPVPAAQTVTAGSKIAEPTAMTKTGSVFGGWYTSSNFKGKAYVFSGSVNGNVTLYAKWTTK